VKTKKTASTKVATLHEEFDEKRNSRLPPLRTGSKLLGKQAVDTARTLITTPVLTDRPVNAYVERVVDHASGEEGFWIWYTTEQSDVVGKKKLVEINNNTLQEILQGEEWSIPYSKKNAEKVASNSFGKTSFIFRDGESRIIIPREKFLDYENPNL